MTTFFRFAPACVCLIGLLAAIVYRHRFGRTAWVAICAFAVLFVTFAGSLIWLHYLRNVIADPANPNWQLESFTWMNRTQWVVRVATSAGFLLLLGALVSGRAPTRTDTDTGDPPS